MTITDLKFYLNVRIEELESGAFNLRNDFSDKHDTLRAVVEELKVLRSLIMRPKLNEGAI